MLGGCDRYLGDLVPVLDPQAWRVHFAGNANPQFERWLAERVPNVPRTSVRVATMHAPALQRVRAQVGPAGAGSVQDGVLAVPEGALPRRAAVAGVRYANAAYSYAALRRLFRGARPDVLHINNGGYPGAETCRIAALAARAEGVPRVVHFVHNMAFEPQWPEPVERRLDRAIDAATDLWLTAAERASDALSAARRIARERIRTVHYGITPPAPPAPASDTGFEPDALNLAMVAMFEPRKGHGVLLEALRMLRDRGMRARVALVGTGPEGDAVAALVAELGLEDSVRLLGWRRDVDAILAGADGLVLPSLANECLPYAILEAMGHGLPVVSTDVAGIPEEVVDGKTGYVVAPGNAAALAERLGRLAADPGQAREMGEAGRRRLRDAFSVEQMVRETERAWLGA